jgi:glucose/arabinose dehydrogenase
MSMIQRLPSILGVGLVVLLIGALAAAQEPDPAAAPKAPPISKLRVPTGFHIEIYATGLPGARTLRRGSKGTIFVGTRTQGRVYAVVDNGGTKQVKIIVSGRQQPNGLAFHNGSLYVATVSAIERFDDIENRLDNPPAPELVANLPTETWHGWRYIGIGPDNKLYVSIGAPCNVCVPDASHGIIKRMNLDGSGSQVVARGVRNSVGFDWSTISGRLLFTDNGRDNMGDLVPHDELNVVRSTGQHFGFPYCHQGNVQDPVFDDRPCTDFAGPFVRLGAHGAALGIRFYDGPMFPAEYQNAMFIARHGSWNRSQKFGADVVAILLTANGNFRQFRKFLSGFIEGEAYLGRPVDVLMMPDGSLLVSDDLNGALYRITYRP